MAELATIARPYAEALFKAAGPGAAGLSAQMAQLSAVAGNAHLRQFAGNPKVEAEQVFAVVSGVLQSQGSQGQSAQGQSLTLHSQVANLLHTVLENNRLDALPEIAAQFQALVNAGSGVSDVTIESAFAIDAAQVAEVVATLEKRFARKLNAQVVINPELIGGIRATVGDEVLDTSVRARLEQMKAALSA